MVPKKTKREPRLAKRSELVILQKKLQATAGYCKALENHINQLYTITSLIIEDLSNQSRDICAMRHADKSAGRAFEQSIHVSVTQ